MIPRRYLIHFASMYWMHKSTFGRVDSERFLDKGIKPPNSPFAKPADGIIMQSENIFREC